MRARGVVIAGLQETRTCGPIVRDMKHYIALVSGCTDQVTHGTEIWVRKEFAIKGSSCTVTVTSKDVSMSVHTPRIFVVHIRCTPLVLDVWCIHAPTASWSKDVVKEFWDELKALTSRYRDDAVDVVGLGCKCQGGQQKVGSNWWLPGRCRELFRKTVLRMASRECPLSTQHIR